MWDTYGEKWRCGTLMERSRDVGCLWGERDVGRLWGEGDVGHLWGEVGRRVCSSFPLACHYMYPQFSK